MQRVAQKLLAWATALFGIAVGAFVGWVLGVPVLDGVLLGMAVLAAMILFLGFTTRWRFITGGPSNHSVSENEAQFRQIVETVADYAVFRLDPDGRIATWNVGAQRIQGYAPNEIIGRHFSCFYPPESVASGVPQTILRRAEAEGRCEDEGWRICKDGSRIWANVVVTALRDEWGKLTGFSKITRNLTERHEADLALRQLNEDLENRVRQRTADLETAVRDVEHARERFELAVSGSRDGIWDWDIRTNEVYYSPRWKSMLGYLDHEIRGELASWEHLVHPDDLARAKQAIADYFEGKLPEYDIEFRMRHKDGRWRWILARGLALRDMTGRPYRMAGSHTDITARKQAEELLREGQRRFRAIFDQTFQFIGLLSVDGVLLEGNRTAIEFAGVREADVLGKPFWETPWWTHSAEQQERLKNAISRAAAGEFVRFEASHPGADGTLHYVDFSLKSVRDEHGKVVMLIPEGRDITDRKLGEVELQRAKEAAEAASRAKSEFLANMSHEIRTPMNGILGMSRILLDSDLSPEQREALEMVHYSAESLMTVINDILDFSKIESGRLDLDPVDFHLPDMLGDTLKTLALRAHEKGLEIACRIAPDVPEFLTGDANRLRQILVNLVGNAVKFTERGEVLVECSLQKAECGSNADTSERPAETQQPATCDLQFDVTDTGIGIPIDKQRLIFQPFTQADGSTTRRFGGTGLGLTICARLVKLMGGTIALESEPGRGSRFRFVVPMCIPRNAPARVPPRAALPAGASVLVVDDNAVNRRILVEMLEVWGLRPTAVDGGPAALAELSRAVAANEPYALVLLDAMMPDMDGFMLAEEMRRRPELAGATVMMLTSSDRQGDGERCRRLGLAGYLVKPIKPSELRRALTEVLTHTSNGKKPAPVEIAVPTDRHGRRLRVLLAEDNVVNQRVVQRLLEKRGHSVKIVGDGAAAVSAARREAFDVVLMDVQMPGMDGFAAVSALRAGEKGGQRLPVVGLTAHAMKGDRERCLAAGMDHYLTKPVEPADLYRVVESLGAETAASFPLERETLGKLGRDPALLAELAGLFRTECPRLLGAIHAAIDAGDARELKCKSHELKGAAAAMGALSLSDAAHVIEMCAKESNLDGASAALPALEAEIDRLTPTLEALEGLPSRS